MSTHTPPQPPLTRARERAALRLIAIFEGVKGVSALALAFGLLQLVHHDTRRIAWALIGHYNLNPEGHYPGLLLHYADVLQNANFRMIFGLAIFYAVVRISEGYGLWRDRAWAEWLAALSGALYVPFELEHLLHKTSLLNGVVLLANIATVAFMVWRLWQRQKAKQAARAGVAAPPGAARPQTGSAR
ncbi:MAG TPA: DUF2127 domain-containing protein [Burkholderiales bacterium]|jgi:uncharacterized membrane protein (DUF2068 family)